MNYNRNECLLHPMKEHEFICLKQHDCQRKLCTECFTEHQEKYHDFQCLAINKFLQKSNEVLAELLGNEKLDLEIKQLIKNISECECKYQSLFQSIANIVHNLGKKVKEQNSNFLILKDKLRGEGIELFSNTELQFLIQNGLQDQLKALNKFQDSCVDQINAVVNNLLNQLNQVQSQIQSEMNKKNVVVETQDKFELFEGKKRKIGEINLIGEKLFKMKHGEYFYKINDYQQCKIQKAGCYLFDLKEGNWVEINSDVQCEGNYFNGIRIGIWNFRYQEVNIFCEYNKEGQKQGKWKEIFVFELGDIILEQGIYDAGKKVGEWKTFYRENSSSYFKKIGGGQFDKNGEKIGLWSDISKEFFRFDAQIICVGEYEQGRRIGEWKILYKEDLQSNFQQIGGGQYDKNGQKVGQWLEINENFKNDAQIIYEGQFKGGLKTGKWKVFYRKNSSKIQHIGGGEYDKNGLKVGKWVDINDNNFSHSSQIFFEGQYQRGLKIGQWKIFYRNKSRFQYLGGGEYDKNSQKVGNWFDIDESFGCYAPFIMEGQYKGGIKIGKWNLLYLQEGLIIQLVGGGEYDNSGKKIGRWIEVDNNYFKGKIQLNMEGFYNNGIKIGFWKLMCKDNQSNFQQIGGGNYDDNGQKIGQWTDIYEKYIISNTLIVVEGQYQFGVKIGKWRISFRTAESNFEQIGGGEYNNYGQKIGNWTDINNFQYQKSKILWEGEYQADIRIGYWKIHNRCLSAHFEQIGGGEYDQNGQKIGKWVDINEKFFNFWHPVVWKGEYQEGKQIDEWRISFSENYIKIFQGKNKTEDSNKIEIGGGRFDKNGRKIGNWIDINESFFGLQKQVVMQGKYEDGVKIGYWKILHLSMPSGFQQIGNGEFDKHGQKIGTWIDIDDFYFRSSDQIISKGEYQAGIKIGEWQILCRVDSNLNWKQLGGGRFDQNGQKQGKWIDLDKNIFDPLAQVIWEGQYSTGVRIGEWKIYFRKDSTQNFYQIGGGQYDQRGYKIGKWVDLDIHFNSANIIFEGLYQTGIPIDEWKILFRKDSRSNFYQIGGGKFDQKGQKIGLWKDISDPFKMVEKQIVYDDGTKSPQFK